MRAVIITTDRFPAGNAGAIRQEILAQLLKESGYNVSIIGLGDTTNMSYKVLEERIKYISLRNPNNNIIDRIIGRIMFSNRVIEQLKNEDDYDLILFISVPLMLVCYLKRKYKESILVHDSVEWYSPCEFNLNILSPFFIKKEINNRILIDKQIKVISISRYLDSYYKRKGIQSIRIPFILDVLNTKVQINNISNKIIFMYAGMIGKKDHLYNFLKAVSLLSPDERNKIEVRLYGFDIGVYNSLLKKNQNIIDKLKSCVHVYGRVQREIIIQNYKDVDFTLLFRNSKKRYAKAGFPTKVVEGMSYGIPPFCNLSSDLEEYLEDGYNSVICKNEDVKSILESLRVALSYSDEERITLRKNARKTAEEHFDYRKFHKEIIQLIDFHNK